MGISSKGAVVEDAEIIGYKSRRKEGDVVILGKEDAAMKLTLPLKQENLCLADLVFNIAEQTDSSVTFVAEQEGKRLQVSYTLRPNAYMLDMDIATQGLEGMAMPGETALLLDWKATVLQQENPVWYLVENQKISDHGLETFIDIIFHSDMEEDRKVALLNDAIAYLDGKGNFSFKLHSLSNG